MLMPRTLISTAICTLGLCAATTPFARAQNVLIEHATVIDGTGSAGRLVPALLVRDGRIDSLGDRRPRTLPRDTRRIDARGRFLIPGLIDTHIHVPRDPRLGVSALHSYLYSGVTTVFDAGNNADYVMDLRERERAGRLLSPRLYATGATITFPKSWSDGPNAILVDAWPEDRAAVDANLARKPDLQKITFEHFGAGSNPWVPSFAPELFTTLAKALLERGVQPVVHISDEARARIVIEAGVTRLAHPVVVGRMSADFVPMLVRRQVRVSTSLAVFDNILRMVEDPAFLDAPPMRDMLTSEQIQELRGPQREASRRMGRGLWFKVTLEYAKQNLRQMHEAGVALALGTDRALGPLTQRELELLVEAGISPLDALKIGTSNAAAFLGAESELGSIAAGRRADLVLLDADPSADIRNLARIHAVFKGGIEIDRRALDLPVNRAGVAAAPPPQSPRVPTAATTPLPAAAPP